MAECACPTDPSRFFAAVDEVEHGSVGAECGWIDGELLVAQSDGSGVYDKIGFARQLIRIDRS